MDACDGCPCHIGTAFPSFVRRAADYAPAGFSLVIGAFAMRGVGGLRQHLHHAEELGGLAHEDV